MAPGCSRSLASTQRRSRQINLVAFADRDRGRFLAVHRQ